MFCFRMDPCTRKPTTPSPVFAPPRTSQVESETSTKDEMSGLALLEKELLSMIEENNAPKNPMITDESPNVNKEEGNLKRGSEQEDVATSPEKKLKLSEEQTVLDVDLTISSDESSPDDNGNNKPPANIKKSNILKKLVKKINIQENKIPKEKIKSNEFVSDSDSDNSNCGETPSKKPNRTIEVPHMRMDGRSRCKFIPKRGPNSGKRCEAMGKGDFCTTHSNQKTPRQNNKNEELQGKKIQELNRRIQSLEDYIEKLRKTFTEDRQRLAKAEHGIFNLKKKLREQEVCNQEIQNKLDFILSQGKSKASHSTNSNTIDTKKLGKLDKSKKYPLIEMNNENIILEANGQQIKVQVPKSMKKPNLRENWTMIYKEELGKWDWERNYAK